MVISLKTSVLVSEPSYCSIQYYIFKKIHIIFCPRDEQKTTKTCALNCACICKWEKNKEYAECYNLAEIEKKIELRCQHDRSEKLSISIAQHNILRTLDGYIYDSGD